MLRELENVIKSNNYSFEDIRKIKGIGFVGSLFDKSTYKVIGFTAGALWGKWRVLISYTFETKEMTMYVCDAIKYFSKILK